MVDDYKHNLWIGTQEGLNILNKKQGRSEKFWLLKFLIMSYLVCWLLDHSVWLGTDSGLCKYIAEKDSFVVYHREQTDGVLDYTAIKSLFEDSKVIYGLVHGRRDYIGMSLLPASFMLILN